MVVIHEPLAVEIGLQKLQAYLALPDDPKGLVIFAHGSGSGRMSPRNNYVAAALRKAGFATLLLDLLTPLEEKDRSNVFDIELLASRLSLATRWAAERADTGNLNVGYFGASTGGGAALMAAAEPDARVAAVVSRGGRPDLAGPALAHVHAPVLLIVGGLDGPVIDMNRDAFTQLRVEKELVIIPGAGHLFEEPGALDQVVHHAIRWFLAHLPNVGDR